jgi:hypothetical protein
MVWKRMGLLDDAIREHLELKRLRGADPGDVAREEQDALGPVRRDSYVESDGQDASEWQSLVEASIPGSESGSAVDSSAVGQETAEINMDVELGEKTDSHHEPAAPRNERGAAVGHPAHTQAANEESLEWEVPADREEVSTGGAASDRDVDTRVGEDHESSEPIEDVLEETPDFLRDTPEQERLWFEQRPPRDFDFNE